MKPMHLKMISCEVFAREANYCASLSPHIVDIEFTEKDAHDHSPTLRQRIQTMIDAAGESGSRYDAILLGYGLCGNAIVGIKAGSIPLVVPRAHDCCAICLGSRKRFEDEFRDNPSMPFSSSGYLERGGSYMRESTLEGMAGGDDMYQEYVEKYGEENARYILEAMTVSDPDNRLVYIDVPEFSHLGYAELCRKRAEADGRDFVLLPGDIRLIRMLTGGQWNDDEFQVIPPGRTIAATYDWDRIVAVE
jgi:hypothetical protein